MWHHCPFLCPISSPLALSLLVTAIVVDFLAYAIGHKTQEHRLYHRSTIVEITMCFQIALTGPDLFLLEVPQRRNHIVLVPSLVVRLGVTLGADLRSQLIFCLLCSEINDIMI